MWKRIPFGVSLISGSLMLSALISCGKLRENPALPPHAHVHQSPESHDPETLEQNLVEIQQSPGKENCDERNDSIKKELVDAVNAWQRPQGVHQEEHVNGSYAKAESVPLDELGYKEVQIGSIPFIETATDTTQPGWKEEVFSWEKTYENYSRIKSSPQHPDWRGVAILVRYLMMYDHDRLVGGVNFHLGKDLGPAVTGAYSIIYSCKVNPLCVLPMFTEDQKKLMESNPLYVRLWGRFNSANGYDEKRSAISDLYSQLAKDQWFYSFFLNKTVRRMGNNEIELPIDLGPFEADQDAVIQYVENAWSTSELKVKVRPTRVAETPDVFKLISGGIAGSPAVTSVNEKLVKFSPYNRITAIAHEIGHVLGFRDNYYTIWKPESCSYVYQINSEDIMSDSTRGSVTREEWETLKQKYPSL